MWNRLSAFEIISPLYQVLLSMCMFETLSSGVAKIDVQLRNITIYRQKIAEMLKKNFISER